MYNHGRHSGWIELICGPMFSGKTEELIRRLRLAAIAKQHIQIFKHAIDNRYDDTYITSHSDQKFKATPVASSADIMKSIHDSTKVIGVDEAQFFDDGIIAICNKLANRGIRVIVAGLDQDFLGNPFGPMPRLMAISESVLKLKAVCMICGGDATKSQRLTKDGETVVVGSGENYEARCRACFDPEHALDAHTTKVPKSKWVEAEMAPDSLT